MSNRVVEIQTLIPHHQWHHVKSEDNPADAISRGIDPSKIKTSNLWWNGPSWLKNAEYLVINTAPQTTEEVKKSYQVTTTTMSGALQEENIYERFSSMLKRNRVISCCLRFIHNCRKQEKASGYLSVQEIAGAQTQIIKLEQQKFFTKEINTLKKKGKLNKESNLLSLHPFIDSNKLLRVGARLKHFLLPYAEKHPVILTPKSHITRLLIQQAHSTTLHGGNQQTLALLQRK